MPSDNVNGRPDPARQLHSGEAPRSPRELDEKIVQHARQKAEQYAAYSSSVGFKWLGDGWKTAVAVFSVAVVAISVTIQVYDNSRTTPYLASRALPDAEVASVESDQDLLPGFSDNALLETEVQQPQISNSAADSSDFQFRTTAPSPSSGVTAEVALRSAERELQAQPEALNLQSVAVEPGLVELLVEIDFLQGIAPADQISGLDDALERLRFILELIESVLIDYSIETEVAETVESASTIELLTAKADTLVDTYAAIENSQLADQLENTYQSRREISSDIELPVNLAITIDVLENWLSDR